MLLFFYFLTLSPFLQCLVCNRDAKLSNYSAKTKNMHTNFILRHKMRFICTALTASFAQGEKNFQRSTFNFQLNVVPLP